MLLDLSKPKVLIFKKFFHKLIKNFYQSEILENNEVDEKYYYRQDKYNYTGYQNQ